MTLSKAHTTSNSQHYEIPKELFRLIESTLGLEFTLDIASQAHTAVCENYYTKDMDAFKLPWCAPKTLTGVQSAVYCNPPYGDKQYPVKNWIMRALEFPSENFVFLLPTNKFSQKWFKAIADRVYLGFITGRVQFTIEGKRPTYTDKKTGKEKISGNSQDSVLVCFGDHFKNGVFALDWEGFQKNKKK